MMSRAMQSGRTRRLAQAAAVAGLAVTGLADVHAASPEQPCGGVIRVVDGRIALATPLTLDDVSTDDSGAIPAKACLTAIAAALADAGPVAVTVSVASTGNRAAADAAMAALGGAADALMSKDVPRTRIDTVVRTATGGQPEGEVEIRLLERRALAAAAQVFALSGPSWFANPGGGRGDIAMGAVWMTGARIETGTGATLRLRLMDGTVLKLGSETVMVAHDAALTGENRRRIRLELVRGEIEVRGSNLGGSFEIAAGQARIAGDAGVFRVQRDGEGVTRLQVLDGTMLLGGPTGDVFVGPGKGARVDFRGAPDTPQAIVVAPLPLEPLYGGMRPGEQLLWDAAPEAESYIVEISREPQFARQWYRYEVKGTSMLLPDVFTNGRWYWRVTGIDVGGALGAPSQIHGFDTP